MSYVVNNWAPFYNYRSEDTQEMSNQDAKASRGTKRGRDEEQIKTKQTSHMKKGKRKVQGVPQSQTAALPRHQEEEETDKTK